jgi:endonuclease/exonuclease/phosphatase family metal-dependent hydrolase
MSKRKSGKSSFFKILLVIINCIFVACLLLSYAAAFINPAKYWIFAFFGIAYPLFLLINLIFVLIWLLSWKKYIFISLIGISLGLTQLFSFVQFRFSAEKHAPGGALKVLTFNVHSLYGKTNKKYNPKTPSEVLGFIAGEKPDIVCVQEFYAAGQDYTQVLDRFAKAVNTEHYFFRNYFNFADTKKINALAIFSKLPMVGNGTIRFRDNHVMAIYADLIDGRDTIRIFNLHLESIRFGNEDYSFYSHLTEPGTETVKIGEGSLKIFGKLKKAFSLRGEQVDIICDVIEDSPYPVIICGDFNDTPSSYTYHRLIQRMNDSFRSAGEGLFGNTYAGNFPSFRIDYILFDKSFRAYNYRRYDTDLSDHYPVSVYLQKTQ